MTGLLTATLVLACVPDVDTDESRLDAPRLLAVRAEPAEARPGETVRLVALYADASGAIDEAPLDWAYCVARKPLAELGPVAPACLALEGDALVPIGTGLDVTGAVPSDACRLFGPEPPPSEDGTTTGRPVDPDVTGGYSQPLRIAVPSEASDPAVSLFELRLACGLFGASQEQSAELRRRYRPNEAPVLDALEIVHADGTTEPLGDEPVTVAAGTTITLRARWPECPTTDVCGDALCGVNETRESCAEDCTADATLPGCGGAERYLRFDLASRALVTEREAMRIAWYASQGALASERTGVAADALDAWSENELTLPDTPSEVVLVVVARDARGGAGWREARLRVEAL